MKYMSNNVTMWTYQFMLDWFLQSEIEFTVTFINTVSDAKRNSTEITPVITCSKLEKIDGLYVRTSYSYYMNRNGNNYCVTEKIEEARYFNGLLNNPIHGVSFKSFITGSVVSKNNLTPMLLGYLLSRDYLVNLAVTQREERSLAFEQELFD